MLCNLQGQVQNENTRPWKSVKNFKMVTTKQTRLRPLEAWAPVSLMLAPCRERVSPEFPMKMSCIEMAWKSPFGQGSRVGGRQTPILCLRKIWNSWDGPDCHPEISIPHSFQPWQGKRIYFSGASLLVSFHSVHSHLGGMYLWDAVFILGSVDSQGFWILIGASLLSSSLPFLTKS